MSSHQKNRLRRSEFTLETVLFFLDPTELASLLAKSAPLLHQLNRYGLKQSEILAIEPPYHGQMHERKSL